MTTHARKQRQYQQREELFLDAAYRMVVEDGYFGLRLDRLAEVTEYAKGTLYLHFRSKEDILLALTSRTTVTRRDLFQRATQFVGRPREKIAAIGVADELFVQLYPGHFKIEALVKTQSLWEKGSSERRQQLENQERECLERVVQVVEAGIGEGDLHLTKIQPAEVVFGLWSISLGVHTLVSSATPSLKHVGITDPYRILRQNEDLYLDGVGWRPLSSEWDYELTRQRIYQEVFPHEYQQIHGQTPS